MAEQGKAPIIKKVKKVVGGGGHGGSWKVAYADFVTAMMAFFLLMWLLSMTEPEKKIKMAQYFRDFTIFSQTGSGILDKEIPKLTEKMNEIKPKPSYLSPTPSTSKASTENATTAMPRVLELKDLTVKKRLKKIIKVRMASFKSNIQVTEEEQGVRIDIMSLEDDPLFVLGDTELTPTMKKILGKLYNEIIRMVDNKIMIEGHTDAIYYMNDKSTNWELSTGRALAVRRELEALGLENERIDMVAGYASTRPLITENPKDPRNRRISMVVLFPKIGKPTETKIVKMEMEKE